MQDSARITDFIIIEDNKKKQINLNETISVKHIHSRDKFLRPAYKFAGEVRAEELTGEEAIVSIDAFAYRQRHQKTKRIIHHRNGGYARYNSDKYISLKLIGIMNKEGNLFLVTEPSNKAVLDIAERMPMRRAGVNSAEQSISRLQKAV